VTTPHDEINHWAPVARDALPNALVVPIEQRDRPSVRRPARQRHRWITTDRAYAGPSRFSERSALLEPTSCWLGSRAAATTSETALT